MVEGKLADAGEGGREGMQENCCGMQVGARPENRDVSSVLTIWELFPDDSATILN